MFLDQSTGWAVGDGGGIYVTTDGGQTWNTNNSGADGSIFGIDFVDHRTGWAVGSGGVILSSVDAVNWTRYETETSTYLLDVAFVNEFVGWAVGRDGTILATERGG